MGGSSDNEKEFHERLRRYEDRMHPDYSLQF
jgi:hypothetical protein